VPNELSVKADWFIYTTNPIFNHGDYRLQFKQGFFPDTSLHLRYRNVPKQFLAPVSLNPPRRALSHT